MRTASWHGQNSQRRTRKPLLQEPRRRRGKAVQARQNKKIIVSGDNGSRSYDETSDMMQDLRRLGAKDADILPDYAGFSTLDSVIRCRNLYGCRNPIVISQAFHSKRAIWLFRQFDMPSAIAVYTKADVKRAYTARNLVREFLDENKGLLGRVYIQYKTAI